MTTPFPRTTAASSTHHTANPRAVGSGWPYGLGVSGLPDARLVLPPPAHGAWPEVRLHLRRAGAALKGAGLSDDRMVLELLDDEVAIVDRRARTATLRCRAPATDGRIVHPFLTAVATAFAWWDGHDAFHGGAFVSGRGAWALLGDREAGKSSLLAALDMARRPVVSDDLLVVDGSQAVFAGPRCVDLRPGAAAALDIEDRVTAVRGGERLRLEALPAPHQIPLHGWIVLGWSERLELRRLQPGQRLHHLTAHHSFPPTEAGRLVELARLPGFELLRPRRWSSLEPAVDALLDLAPS